MKIHLSKALVRPALAAVAMLLTASGCSVSPTDGHTVSTRSELISFEGYIPDPGMTVTINVENPGTGALSPITTATSSSSGQMFDGIEWFPYNQTASIPNSLWNDGPTTGHFAKVRVTTTAPFYSNLYSLGPDWVSCFVENNNFSDFAANCTSPNSPDAYVYTSNFPSNIDLAVEGMSYNSSTQTASLSVHNRGRSGTIARIECFGLHSTIVAEPDVPIAPDETVPLDQWIPTPSGHIVTCTVFGEGIDGTPENPICTPGGPIVTCNENTGQTIAP